MFFWIFIIKILGSLLLGVIDIIKVFLLWLIYENLFDSLIFKYYKKVWGNWENWNFWKLIVFIWYDSW